MAAVHQRDRGEPPGERRGGLQNQQAERDADEVRPGFRVLGGENRL